MIVSRVTTSGRPIARKMGSRCMHFKGPKRHKICIAGTIGSHFAVNTTSVISRARAIRPPAAGKTSNVVSRNDLRCRFAA